MFLIAFEYVSLSSDNSSSFVGSFPFLKRMQLVSAPGRDCFPFVTVDARKY